MFNKDYRSVTIIGFLVGILVVIPLKNLGVAVSLPLFLASVVGFTLFAPLAFFILRLLGRHWPIFEQIGKFCAVGTLNSLINLSVLNIFIYFTDITRGIYFSGFLVIAFIVSKVNSYFWNKFWTFESKTKITIREYIHFSVYTIIGLLLSVGITSILVSGIGAPNGIDPKLWANISAVIAIVATLTWNYLTYRKIVFKETTAQDHV